MTLTELANRCEGEWLDEARDAFITHLDNCFGRESAEDRADDIRAGREDSEEFIAGYLFCLRAKAGEAGE